MMTQPASLSALSQSQSASATGASWSGAASTARKGLIAVLRLIARPARQAHGELGYPLAARAQRFIRGRD
jgi:hypothetical protein